MAGPVPPFPHIGPGSASEAPNGVDSVLPGVVDDAGSRDPSATTVGGAMSNAAAQMAEMRGDAESPAGSYVGDQINLPPNIY
jgi:hypothetical protein